MGVDETGGRDYVFGDFVNERFYLPVCRDMITENGDGHLIFLHKLVNYFRF